MRQESTMGRKLHNFLTTPSLEVAWRCYQDWCKFQEQVGRTDEVGFAGCIINNKICWRVLVTQDLHDAHIAPIVEELRSSSRGEKCANSEPQEEQLPLMSLRTVMLLLTVLL